MSIGGNEDEHRHQREAGPELGGAVGPKRDDREETRSQGLDERVPQWDASSAVAAPASQNEPRYERHVVIGGDLLTALRAARTRADDRLAAWYPVGRDVEEAADDGAERGKLDCLDSVRLIAFLS